MVQRAPRWPMFHKVWRRAALTSRVIEALDINPAVAARIDAGEAYREACAICLACSSASSCRAWLDAAKPYPLAPDFCPNRRFFEACRLDQRNCAH